MAKLSFNKTKQQSPVAHTGFNDAPVSPPTIAPPPYAGVGVGAGVGASNPSDKPPADYVCDFFMRWAAIEQEFGALNEAKKTMLAECRGQYGRGSAEALKLACKTALRSSEKVEAEAGLKKLADYFVGLITAKTKLN